MVIMAIQAKHNETTFHVGDTVRIHYRIIEKEVISGKTKKEKHEEQKERTQVFEGIVLGIKGAGVNQSFMVRRIGVGNIGIERIFPLVSPWIKKVEVKKFGKVRRAKLYYMRAKKGKEAVKVGERLTVKDTATNLKTVKSKPVAPIPSANVKPPTDNG